MRVHIRDAAMFNDDECSELPFVGVYFHIYYLVNVHQRSKLLVTILFCILKIFVNVQVHDFMGRGSRKHQELSLLMFKDLYPTI